MTEAGQVRARLAAAGLAVPPAPAPAGAYVPAIRAGSLVFSAGQLPLVDGRLLHSGHVGDEVTSDQAYECARVCALNALAAVETVARLDEVISAVKLVGYVASADGFISQPAVINGASEVLTAAFGEQGVHAREAVGVKELPLGAPVEVSLVLELG